MTRAHMHARVHVCITCTRTGITHMHEREQASKHVHKTAHTCVCMQFWEQTSERVDTRLDQNVCDSQNTCTHARTRTLACRHARTHTRTVVCTVAREQVCAHANSTNVNAHTYGMQVRLHMHRSIQ